MRDSAVNHAPTGAAQRELSRTATALALSGGADSTALLDLARPDVAFIVDHGLRAESAHEAETVRVRARELGIDAHILRWEGDKPRTGIMEAARGARYRLLIEACHRHGCGSLLVAHHQDDQIETFLMRRDRGSGWRGLAGMPFRSERGGIVLLRPLLNIPKEALVQHCRARGLAYVDDPSNGNPFYTRARVRQEIRDTLTVTERQSILETLFANASRRQQEIECHAHLFATCATIEAGGAIRLRLDSLANPWDTAFLSALVALVNQNPAPPHQGKIAAAAQALQHTVAATVSCAGCLLVRRNGVLWIIREPAAISPLEIGQGEHNINWDDRLRLVFSVEEGGAMKEGAEVRLAPLGTSPETLAWRHLGCVPQGMENLPGVVRASLPALHRGREVCAILDGAWQPYHQPFAQVFGSPDATCFRRGTLKAFLTGRGENFTDRTEA